MGHTARKIVLDQRRGKAKVKEKGERERRKSGGRERRKIPRKKAEITGTKAEVEVGRWRLVEIGASEGRKVEQEIGIDQGVETSMITKVNDIERIVGLAMKMDIIEHTVTAMNMEVVERRIKREMEVITGQQVGEGMIRKIPKDQ